MTDFPIFVFFEVASQKEDVSFTWLYFMVVHKLIGLDFFTKH